MPADALELIKRYERMIAARSTYDSKLQEIKELVRPNALDFNRQGYVGDSRTDKIYDGTALWSLGQFGSWLHQSLTPASDRWYGFTIEDRELVEDEDIKAWLELASDRTYYHYSLSEVGFQPTVHECFLDIGSFGTAVVYQDRDDRYFRPFFKTFPLASCYIDEGYDGKIDTLFRKIMWTKRQVIQRFGEATPSKILDDKDEDKKWHFFHAVYPRKDRDPSKYTSKNFEFASCWVCIDLKVLVLEGGYKEFPYHVPRWTRVAGETYGRSPAWDCLPEIRMINEMSKVVIKAAQKIVDPPLMVPDDGFILPIRTSPSSLLFYQSGTQDRIEPLETKGRVDIGMDMMDQRREQIMKAFYVDFIRAQRKRERQTAVEIMDDRDEMTRMGAPMLGRVQQELLGPMIQRTYNLLEAAGQIPDAPMRLKQYAAQLRREGRGALMIKYVSPAARAQSATKIMDVQRAIQDLAPIGQVRPDIFDNLDLDEVARMIVDLRGVSNRVKRKSDDVMEIRQSRQAQMDLAQAAQVGGTAAAGIKDIALAQAATAKAQGG